MQPKKPVPTDLELANASGIPLQRHLAALIRSKDHQHGWHVQQREELPAGDGFLDMLPHKLFHDLHVFMAIEVKRFNDQDGQPQRLVFLTREDTTKPGFAVDMLSYRDREHMKREHMMGWTDLPHYLLAGHFHTRPSSHTAEHCVFEERRGNVTMDGIARELLGQMEALSMVPVKRPEQYAFLPMLVTNADLRVLQLAEADLETGAMTGPATGQQVPWLRYRKTLAKTGKEPVTVRGSDSLDAWAAERVRTVFVVRANYLMQFLTEIHVTDPPWASERR